MKYTLTCPKCSSKFEYEITTISGNEGAAKLFNFSIYAEHIVGEDPDVDTSGELFKSLVSLREDESILLTPIQTAEWNLLEALDVLGPDLAGDSPSLRFNIDNSMVTQTHDFYLTCPNGHRRKYSVSVEEI